MFKMEEQEVNWSTAAAKSDFVAMDCGVSTTPSPLNLVKKCLPPSADTQQECHVSVEKLFLGVFLRGKNPFNHSSFLALT